MATLIAADTLKKTSISINEIPEKSKMKIYDRVKRALLTFTDLTAILQGRYEISNLPEDAKIMRSYEGNICHGIEFVIYSESFDQVSHGSIIPAYYLVIKTKKEETK